MLALSIAALSYTAPVMRPAVGRAAAPVMSGVNMDTMLGEKKMYGYSKGVRAPPAAVKKNKLSCGSLAA